MLFQVLKGGHCKSKRVTTARTISDLRLKEYNKLDESKSCITYYVRPFLCCIIKNEETGLIQSEILLCPNLNASCASVPPHNRACEVNTCIRKSHCIPSIDLTELLSPGLRDGFLLLLKFIMGNNQLI